MASKRKIEQPSKDQVARLVNLADSLNLTVVRDNITTLIDRAVQQEASYTQMLLSVFELEANTRYERRLARIRKASNLPKGDRRIDDDSYDFSIRNRLEARVVREHLNLRWVTEHGRNVICVGRPGLGKTHVLDAYGLEACRRGLSVIKVDTAALLEQLQASLVDGTYQRTMRRYENVDLLYCDEFGYEPFDTNATKHLFRLVSSRHANRRSIMLAANTGFKRWSKLFPTEAQAVATVDRLVDRATILRFTGKSYRQPQQVSGAETD